MRLHSSAQSFIMPGQHVGHPCRAISEGAYDAKCVQFFMICSLLGLVVPGCGSIPPEVLRLRVTTTKKVATRTWGSGHRHLLSRMRVSSGTADGQLAYLSLASALSVGRTLPERRPAQPMCFSDNSASAQVLASPHIGQGPRSGTLGCDGSLCKALKH